MTCDDFTHRCHVLPLNVHYVCRVLGVAVEWTLPASVYVRKLIDFSFLFIQALSVGAPAGAAATVGS